MKCSNCDVDEEAKCQQVRESTETEKGKKGGKTEMKNKRMKTKFRVRVVLMQYLTPGRVSWYFVR